MIAKSEQSEQSRKSEIQTMGGISAIRILVGDSFSYVAKIVKQ
jgi:hypothetical protein